MPKFIWIDRDFESPGLGRVIDFDRTRSYILHDPVPSKNLTDQIELCYREDFLHDGSSENKCAGAVLETIPGQHYVWRGPIVATGRCGVVLEATATRDLEASDFRLIANQLLSWGLTYARKGIDLEAARAPDLSKVVKAVRINCDGEVDLSGKPRYESVDIQPAHLDNEVLWPGLPDIARLVHFPGVIVTRRAIPSRAHTRSDLSNRYGSALHVACERDPAMFPRRDCMAWVYDIWHKRVGSIVVARRNGKPLTTVQVEALCEYADLKVMKLVQEAAMAVIPDKLAERNRILDSICAVEFKAHFDKLVEEKKQNGEAIDET